MDARRSFSLKLAGCSQFQKLQSFVQQSLMGPPLASLRQYTGLSSARLKSSGIWIHLGDDLRTALKVLLGPTCPPCNRPLLNWEPIGVTLLGFSASSLSACLFSSSGLLSLTVFQHLWIHRHGVRPARAPVPLWQFSHGCYCVDQFAGGPRNLPLREGSLFTLRLCSNFIFSANRAILERLLHYQGRSTQVSLSSSV